MSFGQLHFLAAERLDDDEAQPGQGDDDDEQDGQRHDDARPAAQFGAGDLGERLAAAAHGGGQHEHVLHGAGEADADDQPEQAGHVAVLDGEHRADERAGAGDGGEVVAEEDPLVGRVVVLAVVELMRGRGSRVVEGGDAGGEEGAVVAVGDGQHAQHHEQQRHGAQHDLVADGFGEQVGPHRHESTPQEELGGIDCRVILLRARSPVQRLPMGLFGRQRK